jgi:hypothetical protein
MRLAVNDAFAVHASNLVVLDARSFPRTVSPSNVPDMFADTAGLNGLRWPLRLSEWANDPFALIRAGRKMSKVGPVAPSRPATRWPKSLSSPPGRAADVHDLPAVRGEREDD